jgi:cephalosporin-C deacetylase
MLFDLPIDELLTYRPPLSEPEDFDDFWRSTLAETASHDLDAQFTPYDAGLSCVDVYDARFSGFGGQRIAGWFLTPGKLTEPGPTIVRYIGYGNGRCLPHDWLLWPSAGYSVFVMDSRGQGHGDTGDPEIGNDSHQAGMLTRGILDRNTYYYRRLFADAVRSVDAAAAHPLTDPTRIIVAGASQGGGIAQAVAGLRNDLFAALIDVPFLTHFTRATEITDQPPYNEITEYLALNRHRSDTVFDTLRYFDGIHFASRATTRARYSVGLMDTICPPSTVFAAYNSYGGPAELDVWKFNGHEGGGTHQIARQLKWVRELVASS